jgi:hypothetical protein
MPAPWWEAYSEVVPRWFQTYLTAESTASRIRTYESRYVPGLFQTPAYARAVVQLGYTEPEEIDRRIELRQARQRLLDQPAPPTIQAVITQNAIVQVPLDATDRRAQVDRLIALAERPEITILIIGAGGDVTPAVDSSFTILHFPGPDPRDLVYVEHVDDGQYLDDPAEVARYSGIIDAMVESAEPTHDPLHRMRTHL